MSITTAIPDTADKVNRGLEVRVRLLPIRYHHQRNHDDDDDERSLLPDLRRSWVTTLLRVMTKENMNGQKHHKDTGRDKITQVTHYE